MRKNRIALLLGIVLMLSLVLTGCRSAQKTVQPSYEGESFTENFNTPKPTPTPAPEGEAAEKLSTQDALKQKKNMQFVRADAKTDIMGEGFKLRTMTFRGQISQGLLLPVSQS